MSIQDLGALGSLISSLVVAVTLVYVALQLKQNLKHLISAGMQGRAETMIAMARDAALSDDFAAIFVRSINGDELSPEEQRRIEWWMLAHFKTLENTYLQLKLGVLGDGRKWPIEQFARRSIAMHGYKAIFERNKVWFNQSFIDMVERVEKQQ